MILKNMTTAADSLLWLLFYFSVNLTLTIHNKAVLQLYRFPFPWTLTAIHIMCSTLGCSALSAFGVFRPVACSPRDMIKILGFSILYTVNIAVSNISLSMVTVPFHQVVRSIAPIVTMVLSSLFWRHSHGTKTWISVLPTIVGVSLTTLGDYDYTSAGLILTILGTVLASLKTILTNKLQVSDRSSQKAKLGPLDLLYIMSPPALAQTLVYVYASGEFATLSEYWADPGLRRSSLLGALVFNGSIAFALNFVSFTANRKLGPLMMGVAANMKQVLSVGLAVAVFDLRIGAINALGIVLTLAGGAVCTYVELERKNILSRGQNEPILVLSKP
ncbi:triose-phosphate transporter family-domain-containing protein [Polychytrium aggregatum]|uniref:triose-phosphate transporter family-domain-containing protein n=1 Tax=Polychytrium aggregatum TaxID=110093 RepID=UPI0022FE71C8|nr:triose-phosphate transporter family-domain-containing protein [Polychytrium aggregatum]KAI9207642.1 triose-phosphate transporter family-domain-containing protein [Polychytrium aggregatum]